MATLSNETKVQLGLVIVLIGTTWLLYEKIDSVKVAGSADNAALRAEMKSTYIPRELFTAEFSSLRRENDLQLRPLAADISDLKAAVAALKTQGSSR